MLAGAAQSLAAGLPELVLHVLSLQSLGLCDTYIELAHQNQCQKWTAMSVWLMYPVRQPSCASLWSINPCAFLKCYPLYMEVCAIELEADVCIYGLPAPCSSGPDRSERTINLVLHPSFSSYSEAGAAQVLTRRC